MLSWAVDLYGEQLAVALVEDPPYHMRWLADAGASLREDMIRFVTDKQASIEEFVDISANRVNDLLALRGLLATGLLEHCLLLRHHVNYGTDARRGKTRRVAVPYRASDTPSDRAEYAHPDIMIILTQLSYYYSGLSRADIKEAVSKLLTLGPMAQRDFYNQWLRYSRSTMTDDQLAVLDNVCTHARMHARACVCT